MRTITSIMLLMSFGTPAFAGDYSVRVEGSGSYSGSCSMVGAGWATSFDVAGSGNRSFPAPRSGGSTLSCAVQKSDDGGWALTVIILNNGREKSRASTSQPYGVAMAAG